MIERVARAMYDDYRDPPDLDSGLPWDEMDADARSPWLQSARVAIEAMREPTPEMVGEVVQQVGDPTPEQWAIGERANALLTETNMLGETACAEVVRDWTAMINAALSTPPEPVGRE